MSSTTERPRPRSGLPVPTDHHDGGECASLLVSHLLRGHWNHSSVVERSVLVCKPNSACHVPLACCWCLTRPVALHLLRVLHPAKWVVLFSVDCPGVLFRPGPEPELGARGQPHAPCRQPRRTLLFTSRTVHAKVPHQYNTGLAVVPLHRTERHLEVLRRFAPGYPLHIAVVEHVSVKSSPSSGPASELVPHRLLDCDLPGAREGFCLALWLFAFSNTTCWALTRSVLIAPSERWASNPLGLLPPALA